jgi:dephospho-CoA kinase
MESSQKRRAFRVGITGGIGSGKSTVSKIFETLGIPVFYADQAAKDLVQNDQGIQAALKAKFGSQIFDENQLLNRAKLASLVFNDPDALQWLNDLLHPATIQAAEDWMNRQTTPYCVKEAALIFESGTAGHLDWILGVFAPEALRIHRVMKRDGIDQKQVKERMKNQIQEDIKMRLCDAIVLNNEQQALLPQVLQMHHFILEKIKQETA